MTMRKADPQDPMELVGMRLATNEDDEEKSIRDMVGCLAEEYLLMGFSPERLLGLFKDPFYRGPHEAYRKLGEAQIFEMIKRTNRTLRPVDID